MNTRLLIISPHNRALSRTMTEPVDRDVEISTSIGISRRAGEEGEETDMIRVDRLTVGLISAIRGYCFWESARPVVVDMRKNSRSKRRP